MSRSPRNRGRASDKESPDARLAGAAVDFDDELLVVVDQPKTIGALVIAVA